MTHVFGRPDGEAEVDVVVVVYTACKQFGNRPLMPVFLLAVGSIYIFPQWMKEKQILLPATKRGLQLILMRLRRLSESVRPLVSCVIG